MIEVKCPACGAMSSDYWCLCGNDLSKLLPQGRPAESAPRPFKAPVDALGSEAARGGFALPLLSDDGTRGASSAQERATIDDERRRAAATRSYVVPAVITLVLYLFLWLPGAIVNIVYLQHASRDEQLLGGESPDGKGCLTALLWVFLVPGAVGVLGYLVFGAFMLGGAAGGAH